jgi:2-keto-4-pentenoate hydratase/2-oxohepta-3-ene-1,7-dioic acid hydratase in catechol pathway
MALKKSCNTISMIFTTLISDISQYGPPSLSPGMGLFTGTPEIIAGRRAS